MHIHVYEARSVVVFDATVSVSWDLVAQQYCKKQFRYVPDYFITMHANKADQGLWTGLFVALIDLELIFSVLSLR